MKLFTVSAILVVLAFVSRDAFGRVGGEGRPRSGGPPPEILVVLDGAAAAENARAQLVAQGHSRVTAVPHDNMLRVRLAPGTSVGAAMAAARNLSGVTHVQPSFTYRAAALPNDPLLAQQWGLRNVGQTIVKPVGGVYDPDLTNNPPPAARHDMSFESAWNIRQDCSNVIVAVIDTGVAYAHEDLRNNLWNGNAGHGYDFSDRDADPVDENGHGTHVAAIIAAEGNNALGGTGVCWRAQLMALRVLDADGYGSTLDIADAVDYAVAQGARVLNLSLEGFGFDPILDLALSRANARGVVTVVVAGNYSGDTGVDPYFPCNHTGPGHLCVAALDQAGALATFSNFGGYVHLGAPGQNVLSAWNGDFSFTPLSLTSGWTFETGQPAVGNAGWAYRTFPGIDTDYPTLATPMDYSPDHTGGLYRVGADDVVYRGINLAEADFVTLFYQTIFEVAAGDRLNVLCRGAGGNPTQSGSTLRSYAGADNTVQFAAAAAPIGPACKTTTASIGFQLKSNGGSAHGAQVNGVAIRKLRLRTNRYEVISGTSMAAPHVAGLAALVLANQPRFNGEDAVRAILGGGTPLASLAGKTITGKAANAYGALRFLAAPTGLDAETRPLP